MEESVPTLKENVNHSNQLLWAKFAQLERTLDERLKKIEGSVAWMSSRDPTGTVSTDWFPREHGPWLAVMDSDGDGMISI